MTNKKDHSAFMVYTGNSTPDEVADKLTKLIKKATEKNPDMKKEFEGRKWMQDKVKNHLVELYIKTDIELFPLVASLRKHLQAFMDENKPFIKNDPMVFITTEFRKVNDKYTGFEGVENGGGYREWCSYDKGEGY